MKFANKTALITGATRGIGYCIAENFARQGANTILLGRNFDRVKATEELFQKNYEQQTHQGVVLDVGNKDDIGSVLKDTLKGHSIDYLINAAGISRDSLFVQLKNEDLEEVMNTNLLGTMRLTQYVAKSMMRKRKGGCIVNISSVIGLRGNSGQTAYSASKAGLIGFTRSLSKELGPLQIRVNAIAPGFIETDMTANMNEDYKSKVLSGISLKRFGKVQDVALATEFIAESDYIHGQVLTIDGGLMI
ncbi:3-oxoacyl-reductase [Sporodiniella umbellata]|nr:3-oxoacyl-reductase [Sporodiniella umbellata]